MAVVAGRSTQSLGVIVDPVVLWVIVVLVIVNTLATVIVVRSDMFDRRQKLMQFALVWLIPVVGSSLAYLFTRKPASERFGTYIPPQDSGAAGGDHSGGGDGH